VKRVGGLVMSAALSATLMACGGADGRTQAAFEEAVAPVCDAHVRDRSAAAEAHFTSETEPPTVEQLQAFYADFAPDYRAFVDDLEEIEPPDGREDDYERLLVALRRNADAIEQAGDDAAVAQHLLETDEAELHEPDEIAVDLGFDPEC
jgi:hypothetical protein